MAGRRATVSRRLPISPVLDASVAAAWVLPDADTTSTDAILLLIAAEAAVALSLFWHELRNILLMVDQRGRLPHEEVVPSLLRLRRLPIETVDGSANGDANHPIPSWKPRPSGRGGMRERLLVAPLLDLTYSAITERGAPPQLAATYDGDQRTPL